jgi:hypothetical protein
MYLIARGKPLYGSALSALSLFSLASSLPGAPENETMLGETSENGDIGRPQRPREMSKIDAIMHPQWLPLEPLEYFQSLNAERLTGIRPKTEEQ